MHSPCGRYTLAYNGEIYNYLDLRRTLEDEGAAPAWRGHSDTEVLLAGVAAWGLAETLTRCIGMFAIALWDRETRRLTLARDRFGEKPLHVAVFDGEIAFASELKALARHPRWSGEIDRAGHRPVPSPRIHPRAQDQFRPGPQDPARGLRRDRQRHAFTRHLARKPLLGCDGGGARRARQPLFRLR